MFPDTDNQLTWFLPLFQPKDILKSLDEKDKEIDSLIAPDGTKKFPAKTCYDLFLDHKHFKSGESPFPSSFLL